MYMPVWPPADLSDVALAQSEASAKSDALPRPLAPPDISV